MGSEYREGHIGERQSSRVTHGRKKGLQGAHELVARRALEEQGLALDRQGHLQPTRIILQEGDYELYQVAFEPGEFL